MFIEIRYFIKGFITFPDFSVKLLVVYSENMLSTEQFGFDVGLKRTQVYSIYSVVISRWLSTPTLSFST